MPYKVQVLTPEGHRRGTATCITPHWKEEAVLQQVEVELPKILGRGQKDLKYVYSFAVPKAFIGDMEDMFAETSRSLAAQDVGGAYMRWRDFADFWEDQGVSVADWWGDVIVEQAGVDKFYFYPEPIKKKYPRRGS